MPVEKLARGSYMVCRLADVQEVHQMHLWMHVCTTDGTSASSGTMTTPRRGTDGGLCNHILAQQNQRTLATTPAKTTDVQGEYDSCTTTPSPEQPTPASMQNNTRTISMGSWTLGYTVVHVARAEIVMTRSCRRALESELQLQNPACLVCWVTTSSARSATSANPQCMQKQKQRQLP